MPASAPVASSAPAAGEPVTAPLAGNIWKVEVSAGQQVEEGEVLLILEAMKMETQIVAPKAGLVSNISVNPGDAVKVGDLLVSIA
jgi:oxaloacetate decarboxylase alpha subunit